MAYYNGKKIITNTNVRGTALLKYEGEYDITENQTLFTTHRLLEQDIVIRVPNQTVISFFDITENENSYIEDDTLVVSNDVPEYDGLFRETFEDPQCIDGIYYNEWSVRDLAESQHVYLSLPEFKVLSEVPSDYSYIEVNGFNIKLFAKTDLSKKYITVDIGWKDFNLALPIDHPEIIQSIGSKPI